LAQTDATAAVDGERTLAVPLFLGVAVASIGGPLALGALYLPGALGDAVPSSGLATVLAILIFAAPIAVWVSYSRRIASSGGLTAFVRAGGGTRVAWAQAAVWAVSYALYLPFTVTDVVYDLLPNVFPGMTGYRTELELALPIAISALVLARVAIVLSVLLVVAVAQLGLLLVLGFIELAHAGEPAHSLAPHVGAGTLAHGTLALSLLFVCASLPLFFGGEVRGGTRTIRRALIAAFCVVSAYLLIVAIPLAQMPPELRSTAIPGMTIADAYSSHSLAVAIGATTAASIVGLIVVEFLALGRLAHYMLGVPIRAALAVIAVPFIAIDAISLIDPEHIYADLLRPSLIALFIAQATVFIVYPLYRRAQDRRGWVAASLVAAVAAALMLYGLYNAITSELAT
jgi:amino acid transporter